MDHTSSYEALSSPDNHKDKTSGCLGRMQTALHSLPFQVSVLLLVVLDAFIVVFELLLDLGAFQNISCQGDFLLEQASYCHYNNDTRSMCGPSPKLILTATNLTAGDGSDYCRCGYRLGSTVCINHTEGEGINPAFVLHIMSLSILTIFLFELGLKLIAFRLKYFLHKFEVFDGLVVVISWILDIASTTSEKGFTQLVTLIIILRLWRVVRVINGAILSAKTTTEQKLLKVEQDLHREQAAYNQLKRILQTNGIQVPEKPNVEPTDEEFAEL